MAYFMPGWLGDGCLRFFRLSLAFCGGSFGLPMSRDGGSEEVEESFRATANCMELFVDFAQSPAFLIELPVLSAQGCVLPLQMRDAFHGGRKWLFRLGHALRRPV
ncbi:MAG: hypothetical protein GYA33_07955 [Thermogutta sp.]|nr:hypothetical protein [Thermogutta sp.]